jgi:hypothetical protein
MSVGDIPGSPALGAMLAQLAPTIRSILQRVQPLIDQPVIRMPYALPLVQSQVIPAGSNGFILNATSFSWNLEWPLEVHAVKFSNDPMHTFRDWRIAIQDQTFNQPFQKNPPMVADLVDDNTGKWEWRFPWIVRPKGGGLNVAADNLDTVNPITVDISFLGYALLPR